MNLIKEKNMKQSLEEISKKYRSDNTKFKINIFIINKNETKL